MKTKLRNVLRGKKRKKEQICQAYGYRYRRFIYIKDELQGEKKSRKSKQRNKCRRNGKFKKLKI